MQRDYIYLNNVPNAEIVFKLLSIQRIPIVIIPIVG